jgi:hypothetical protein
MSDRILRADQLQRGDVVKAYPPINGAWHEMTVERVEKKDGVTHVTFFRPYVIPLWTIMGDDRCVPTVGVERFTGPCHSGHQYTLVSRIDHLTGKPS